MIGIKREIKVDIHPTPVELAKVFCSMDANQQAVFFNEIAHVVKCEWDRQFVFQLQAISDSKKMSDSGRLIMSQIGDYAFST